MLNKAIEEAVAVADNLTPETYKEHFDALTEAMEFGQDAIDAATALETKKAIMRISWVLREKVVMKTTPIRRVLKNLMR